eukprot:scaffold8150_cov72-Phaeocystis_antarctica.AAC.11
MAALLWRFWGTLPPPLGSPSEPMLCARLGRFGAALGCATTLPLVARSTGDGVGTHLPRPPRPPPAAPRPAPLAPAARPPFLPSMLPCFAPAATLPFLATLL